MITSEDLRDLADVGFIAWSRGLDEAAASIFEAIRLVRPNKEAGHLGGALVLLRAGDPAGAAAALRRMPPSHVARCLLGLALVRMGEREEGIEMLENVRETAGSHPASALACSLLAGSHAKSSAPIF